MDSQQNRLLVQARRAFAEFGYSGASVRTIAAAANANVALVSYYFGSKEGLFRAVLADLEHHIHERLDWARHSAPNSAEAVWRTLVQCLVADFPESVSVIWSHALQTAPGFPAHDCRQTADKLVNALTAALGDTPAPRFAAERLLSHLITHIAAIDAPPLTKLPKSDRVRLAEKLTAELWTATAMIGPNPVADPKPRPKRVPLSKANPSPQHRQAEPGQVDESQAAAEVEPREVPADFLGGFVD